MARYEREKQRQVLGDVGSPAAPDPNVVVARVSPDGKIVLGRLDLAPAPIDPVVASSDDSGEAAAD